MANSLYPAFVEIEYHSPYAPHTMTIPLRAWSNTGGVDGQFTTWGGTTIGAADAVEDIIELLAPFFAAAVVFDGYTIFTMASPTAEPIPVYSENLAVAGTNATPGNYKAVQGTFTFRTADGGVFKSVLLDVGNNNNFERVTSATLGGAGLAFSDYVTGDDSIVMGRDDSRPTLFRQLSFTLNEKLRREYRMT